MPDWRATLNGSTMSGGAATDDPTVHACLKTPPTGTGVPSLRTEDVTYPQRDGVQHFADWYEGRILTFEGVIGNTTGCSCNGDARDNARDLVQAWSRSCDDDELVLWTGCETTTTEADDFEGALTWTSQISTTGIALTTDVARSPTHSLEVTKNTGVGTALVSSPRSASPDAYTVLPGQEVRASAYVRAKTLSRGAAVQINFYDAADAVIGSVITGPQEFDSALGWTEVSVSAVAPPLAAKYVARVRWASVPLAEVHFVDDFSSTVSDGVALRGTVGPFGVRGRARVMDPVWRRGRKPIADVVARFDATDERLFVLDVDGAPGSGEQCVTQSTGADPVTFSNYDAAVAVYANHHNPLDFERTGPWDPGLSRSETEDIIGSFDASIHTGISPGPLSPPRHGPAMNYGLGLSALQGPFEYSRGLGMPGGYTSGMFAFWLQTPVGDLPSGASFTIGTNEVGNTAGAPAAKISWGSALGVNMNTAVQDAFGFTSALRGKAVLIMLTWNTTNLWISTWYEGKVGPWLAQTITGTGMLPAAASGISFKGFGNVQSVFSGANQWTTSTAAEDDIDYIINALDFYEGLVSVTVPEGGDLCVPFAITFGPGTPPLSTIYVFNESGEYVGLPDLSAGGLSMRPHSIDTETGRATAFYGTVDVSNLITGNPFMKVRPGETLHVFANEVATICFRPAVLSA